MQWWSLLKRDGVDQLQSLNDSIASADSYRIELQCAIEEKDTVINEAKTIITAAQARLEAAQHQKLELELNLAELTKKWDSQVMKFQAETKRLLIIRSQAAPIDPRILKEKAQNGAHEVRDSRMAKCIA
ncbi:uncharacterized protein A4U43_C08F14380 [Asparagus officinalis]|nr:uncharacterized protein A4U43_C08F14380 [Asparagus officinalis]